MKAEVGFHVYDKFSEIKDRRLLHRNYRRAEQWLAYLFIAPQFIGIIVFILIPVLVSIVLCFTDWDLIGSIKFVGFENFYKVFQDERISKALLNTFIFVAGIIPLTTIVSLGLALVTNRKVKGLGFFKATYFLPMATASVAIVLVWYWIFAPNIGILNFLLHELGIEGPGWLTESSWAKVAIILMNTWQGMGYYYLIFLAGLKGIPKEYFEAASMDGANTLQQFFGITLPLLSTTTFFVLITMTISAFNLFQEPMVLTQGGPDYSTYTLVMYIYDLAFKYFRMGESAVVSLVLFLSVILFSFVQFRFSGKWIHTID